MIRNFLLAALLSLGITISLSADNIKFSPEKPSPGETINIRYDISETPLEKASNFDAIAFLLKDDGVHAVELNMLEKGSMYVASLKTDDAVKAVFITFRNDKEQLIDNNEDKGYKLKMYTADKSKAVQGAYHAIARAFYYDSYAIGVTRDAEASLKYLNKEFKNYPSSKEKVAYLRSFSNIVSRQKDEAGQAELRTIADEFAKAKKEESKITFAHSMYKMLGEEDIAKKLEKTIKKKYPKGELVMTETTNQFYNNRNDLDAQENAYASLARIVDPANEDQVTSLDFMATNLANSFARMNNWEKFDKYADAVNDKTNLAGMFNNLAWGLSGGNLDSEIDAEVLERAEQMSKQSLAFVKGNMEDLEKNKPSQYTSKVWKNIQNRNYGMYADTYALICYKLGRYEDAYAYQKEAIELNPSPDAYERYVTFFEKENGPEETEALLAELIQKGEANAEMEKRHKELFMKNNDLASAYQKYVDQLKIEAKKKFRKDIEKKLISMDAPNFTLKDLEGKEVVLSEMKGKVIILDFWATWCGPCKASFPGMQKALNKLSEKYNAAFLFIDTWENVEEKEKNAAEFIKKNDYTFHVLMDNENKVVANYKVEGIPTKFIIGPNGKIRFKSVGFSGDNDKLVEELEVMIKMAREKADEGPTSLGEE